MDILVISKSINLNSPQAIRFNNLINQWTLTHKISLVSYDNEVNINSENFKHFPVKLNSFNKFIIKLNSNEQRNSTLPKRRKIRSFFKRLKLKTLLFPDIFILENKNLKKKILYALNKSHYDIVILSAFPFSYLIHSEFIKRNTKNTKIIYDTGDPFYGNSSKTSIGLFQKLFSFQFEKHYLKYIDFLVLPNNFLKSIYLQNYSEVISEKSIIVIEQGYNIVSNLKAIPLSLNKHKKLIYAGSFYKKIREPYELFNAINESNNVSLDIFGNIQQEFIIETDKIKFPGVLTQEKILQKYSEYDAIVFIDNFSGVQIPGKVYEILNARKPVLYIYQEKTPTYFLFENYNYVIFSQYNKSKIIYALEELFNNLKLKEYNFNFNGENYTWAYLSKKYIELINKPIDG